MPTNRRERFTETGNHGTGHQRSNICQQASGTSEVSEETAPQEERRCLDEGEEGEIVKQINNRMKHSKIIRNLWETTSMIHSEPHS